MAAKKREKGDKGVRKINKYICTRCHVKGKFNKLLRLDRQNGI